MICPKFRGAKYVFYLPFLTGSWYSQLWDRIPIETRLKYRLSTMTKVLQMKRNGPIAPLKWQIKINERSTLLK